MLFFQAFNDDSSTSLSSSDRSRVQDCLADHVRALVCLLPALEREALLLFHVDLLEAFLSDAVAMDTRLNLGLCLVQEIKATGEVQQVRPSLNRTRNAQYYLFHLQYFNSESVPWLERVLSDPASHICFCQALLIKLTSEELLENGSGILLETFKRICDLSKR